MADTYDIVGVGFGPANLALAVAAREIDPVTTCLFAERNSAFCWHPGMLLDGVRMQISFLKDLVSMRNLASPHSFLNYLKHKSRLEHFINLNEFFPSRIEYSDYLKWVAADFADQVRYGTEVVAVSRDSRGEGASAGSGNDSGCLFQVRLRRAGGEDYTVRARNVVVATGGRPRPAMTAAPPQVIHSSEFLPRFPECLPDASAPYEVLLAGDGQSAGEIAQFILTHYSNTRLHLLVSGYAPRPVDNSPFVNEHFFSLNSSRFHEQDPRRRARQLADLRSANYGVIEDEVIDELYRLAYLDEVKGRRRLFIHSYSKLRDTRPAADGVAVTIEDRLDGTRQTLSCDAVVLATGYERGLDERVFGDLLPYISRDEAGELILSDNYRVRLSPALTGGLYVQGLGERSFGLGDTLLSMLPFRSEQIFTDIKNRLDHDRSQAVPGGAAYPPRRHLEHDPEKLYAVIERFKFATLISARDADDPVVSQVPLTLDRSSGRKGLLFGHLDRTNPHARLLDDRPVTVLFHGPDSYISPRVYMSDQLPTWNSITVKVQGRARIIREQARVVDGLCGIAAKSEPDFARATLDPGDPRIGRLIEYIVGFEIEILDLVGRFKLSQDRDDDDRKRAAKALADAAKSGQHDLIGYLVGMCLDDDTYEGNGHYEDRRPEVAVLNGGGRNSVGAERPSGT